MPDYLSEARAIGPELAALRESVHREPELGNREYRTAAKIEAFLHSLGIETERLLDTAVVGRLRGGRPGPTAALRADMDALPLTEATGAAFASATPGVMHACGHDVHVAAALGAAKLLAAHRDELPGSVLFLFQPDEEGDGGAQRMIDAGALDGADAVFGAHVAPDLPAGAVGVRSGKFYAAADLFRVVLTGKSCHGAEREKGVDALAAGAALVTALLALPDETDDRCVLTVGTFRAGTAENIVPGTAELHGMLRTLGPDARRAMRERISETVADVSRSHGVKADLELRRGYPGIVNDGAMTELAANAARNLLGPESVRDIGEPTMKTEDFGYYLAKLPGSYYHIGAGCPVPLHNPAFLPDPDAVVTAAAVHAAVIDAYLRRNS